ncbi:MAG: dTDP-4-dehydrorhamnose 3,5-epimerase [Burkholderiales bacterium]
MRISDTPLQGALLLEPEPITDERGFFARTFCVDELAARGLRFEIVQCNVSGNRRRGTLRGLHFQRPPHAEGKIVSCLAGSLLDVIVDLRPESPSFRRWHAVELSASNRLALAIPPGFAHGFQTLEDGTDVQYLMSHRYVAQAADGVRWNDPAFGIRWPIGRPILSARDAAYPDFGSGR